MTFRRIGKIKDDALERKMEITPSDKPLTFLLPRLNYLLGFLIERIPEQHNEFISNLETVYKEKTNSDAIGELKADESILSEYPNLQRYPTFAECVLNYYLHLIGSPDSWDNPTEIAQRRYFRAFLIPSYYQLEVLINTIGHDEAIKLWKQIITTHIIQKRKPREKPFVDLETWFAEREFDLESEWSVVHGIMADGKFAFRNNNCLWIDSLTDLPDSEIKYYVCCYGDYEGARDLHESIIMTMEHTIAQGDPYCSRVMHDTRVDYNLSHPPKEFWDDMENR